MDLSSYSHLVFISGFFPSSQYNEIIQKSKGPIQFAADALQKSIIAGLISIVDELTIINSPCISSFPKYYTSIYSPNRINYIHKETNGHIANILSLRYCNIKGYKMFSKYIGIRKELLKYCKDINDNDTINIIVYGIHLPYLQAAIDAKNKFKNVRITCIAPDLPEYMDGNMSFIKKQLKNIQQKRLDTIYLNIDSYIVLTKYMAERLCVKNQPFRIIEGIFNPTDYQEENGPCKINKYLTILYTGTLDKRYDIMNLVKAVKLLKREDIRLLIIGDGDSKNEILQIAKTDNRIVYLGQKKRSEVLKLQREANLLVNPRLPKEVFTKYSFPSKTMEYLASGTPTLIYRLPGIPDEYFKFCFTPKGDMIEDLSDKIDEILSMDRTELKKFGENARQFVLKEKNPHNQCKKIIELL